MTNKQEFLQEANRLKKAGFFDKKPEDLKWNELRSEVAKSRRAEQKAKSGEEDKPQDPPRPDPDPKPVKTMTVEVEIPDGAYKAKNGGLYCFRPGRRTFLGSVRRVVDAKDINNRSVMEELIEERWSGLKRLKQIKKQSNGS